MTQNEYLPIPNPSGNGKQHLIARQKEVLAAVRLLVSELRRAHPNRRDYRHLIDQEYESVLRAYREQIESVLAIQTEHEAILEHLRNATFRCSIGRPQRVFGRC